MNIALQLLTLIAAIVGELKLPANIQSVINTLTSIIPVIAQEIADVLPAVKNIITALKNNSAVTADQMAQLAQLDAQTDAAFEAAAQAAGETPPA